MAFISKKKPVYYKLLFSNIIIILLVTIPLAVFSYFFFSTEYNKQIISLNQHVLSNIRNNIEQAIVFRVESIYLQVTSEPNNREKSAFLFNQPLQSDSLLARYSYDYLQKLVLSNSDIIDSVHIYYNKSDIVISSAYGLKYRTEEDVSLETEFYWLSRAKNSPQNDQWLEIRLDNNSNVDNASPGYSTFVRRYPFTANQNSYKGYVAIDVKQTAIFDIISQNGTLYDGYVLVLDKNGKVISHSIQSELTQNYEKQPFVNDIFASLKDDRNFIKSVNDIDSMVSYTTLSENGWKIIKVIPIEQFYPTTFSIQIAMVIVSIIIIFVGLLIANTMSLKTYMPLRNLINNIKGKSISPVEQLDGSVNEYTLIDNAITYLTSQVTALEYTLDENKPLIKHNLIQGLLTRQINTESELEIHCKLLDISMNLPYFRAILIKIDTDGIIEHTSNIGKHIYKYHIIHFIDSLCNDNAFLLSTSLQEFEIGVILNSNNIEDEWIQSFLSKIDLHIKTYYGFKCTIVIGSYDTDIFKTHASYVSCRKGFEYSYFLPEKNILFYSNIADRENSKETIPDDILEDFKKSLKTNNLEGIKTIIETICGYMQTGNYSAQHCHNRIINIMYIYTKYLKSMKLSVNTDNVNINEILNKIKNLYQFKEWLVGLITQTSESVDLRNSNQNYEIIEKVKAYIDDNLDGNLSLDFLADISSITPSYLSTLFKTHTGTNFSDFILQKRMDKAQKLLIETNLNIDQIAHKVGFSSSGYFITKFKEFFGTTPKNYKKDNFKLTL